MERRLALPLRVLYEHVVVFCWMLIAPEARFTEWQSHSRRLRRVLHDEALPYGFTVLTPAEREAADAGRRRERLSDLADEADAFWPAHVPGFRPKRTEGMPDILNLHGLYLPIYRLGSRPVHAEAESVDPCVERDRWAWVVRREDTEALTWSGLATPLFAMALLAGHYRLGWPDEQEVRRINDELTRLDPPADD